MSQGGYYQQKRGSPAGLTVVILLHGAAIAALAMANISVDVAPKVPNPDVIFIPDPIEPPPAPPEPRPDPKTPDQPQHRTRIDQVPPKVPTMPSQGPVVDSRPVPEVPYNPTPPGRAGIEPARPVPLPVPAQPVRRDAVMDSRSELQPPYPASEQRSGEEGTAVVRILIGADGRVQSVEKVRATNDAFFRAAERHALRNWRFKPATVDGRPVEARKTFSLKFELTT